MTRKLNRESYEEFELVVLVKLLSSSNEPSLVTEVYKRLNAKFYDFLYKITGKLYSKFDESEINQIRKDIHQEVFILFFEEMKTFNSKENWTDKECKKILISWLNRTANNLLLKQYGNEKKEKKALIHYKILNQIDNKEGEIGKRKCTYNREKLKSIMDNLRPIEKEILMACMNYNTIDNGNSLPFEIKQALSKKYNVKINSLRKIKERTLIKIRKCKL